MSDRWQDRDRPYDNQQRWGSGDRGREDDDEYQRRRHGYDEAREHWRNTEPRYGYRPREEWRRESRGESYPESRRETRQEWHPESWRESRQQSWGRDQPSRYRGGGYDDDRGWWDRTKDEVRSWMGDPDAERRRQADHTGRGPKGYTRSDERIREDVSDRLMADWEVDATDIEVTVASCEVTLAGTVGDRQSKRRAEDIAANVLGVKDVQNSLRVRQVDPFATGRGGCLDESG